MSTQKQLSRTTGTERMFKEELALSLICWVFTSPFTNWTDKVFSGIEVPSEGPSSLRGETEKFFRFVVNEEGYDAGRAALGLDLCCFSLPSCLFPDAALSEEEVMSKLTGEVIHGILLSLPEVIDMPEVLAYQVRDEILAFNTRCGDGIFHGWNTASELWKFEIFPRTTIMMQHTSAIH
ncbi:hypothetical protein OVA10_24775 [Lelliottia sp. SL45]|uniref:hypothetical protein n=1 Tax=Lelliottia sp. SL45 TaxID=2994665 RepID=UPI0017EE6E5A|nr:hypothetical protein [Lelliottia sp. SL45]EFD0234013.1 hypothetical protein [Escherichia coli]EIB5899032.1 hypothetical protein [Salmonella enterica subsp. enterica serovar Montevideo]EKQ2101802.1 hypothetical protein [Salmonella enterica]EFI5675622.1 hypothetical protein [Escherichia coli]EIB5970401.1 hypothetical protein [Salmonella enterica subsp. enterica serovar Montevideo]